MLGSLISLRWSARGRFLYFSRSGRAASRQCVCFRRPVFARGGVGQLRDSLGLVSCSAVRPSECSSVATVGVVLSRVRRSDCPDVAAACVRGGLSLSSVISQYLVFSDVSVPFGSPYPWLRGYREVFLLSAVEHFLSSVSAGGVCVFPPFRLPPRSWEIRMFACLQAVCPLNRAGLFSGSSGLGASSGCPAACRNTGTKYLSSRRPSLPTACSCGIPAP